jgi:hypothetical protein
MTYTGSFVDILQITGKRLLACESNNKKGTRLGAFDY